MSRFRQRIAEARRRRKRASDLADAIACIPLGAATAFFGLILLLAGSASDAWLPPLLLIGGLVWAGYGIKETQALLRASRTGR